MDIGHGADDAPLISLVVPVYNVAAYLDRCMEGVLAQTYPNCEILLVDDGSTDGSGELCDGYGTDGRVRVFHKKNGGLSDARNYGVARAAGEWVAFVDSDDVISEDYLQYMYRLHVRQGTDIVCARMMEFPEGARFRSSELRAPWERKLSAGEAIEMACLGSDIGMSACAKLYRRELLARIPYPVGKLYEDLSTTYKLFDACGQVAVGSRCVYGYIQHGGSIRHQTLSEKQFYGFDAAAGLLEYVRRRYPQAEHAAQVRCALKAVEYVPSALADRENGKRYFKRIRMFLGPHVKAALSDSRKGLHFKLCCVAVMLGYYPSKLFWTVCQRLKKVMVGRRARAVTG